MGRFRFGLLMGFGLGYWFGAKAGRERYRQLNGLLQKARGSEAVAAAAERARELVETGVERGRDLVEPVRDASTPEPPVTDALIDAPAGPNGSVNPGLPTPEIS